MLFVRSRAQRLVLALGGFPVRHGAGERELGLPLALAMGRLNRGRQLQRRAGPVPAW